MRLTDGRLRIAATDASSFLACRHLTLLNLAKAHALPHLPPQSESFGGLADIEQRGLDHEAAVLASYEDAGWSITKIPKREPADVRRQLTLEAMRDGIDVIYQGVLTDGTQFGAPDFLIRASLLDDEAEPGSYEVVDAKLARSAKAAAVLQTAFYSRQLEAATGVRPRRMHLELGDGRRESLRAKDFAAYERATLKRLEELLDGAEAEFPIQEPYPEKVEHCGICSWRDLCRARRRDDDDLSLVAGASLKPRRLLKAAGIGTLTALADLGPNHGIEGLQRETLKKLRLQAAAQMKTTDPRVPYWEFADEEEGHRIQLADSVTRHDPQADLREPLRGLFALPEPSRGDLFFDLEAARFYGGGPEGFGLEYLFGLVDAWSGDPTYEVRWAFDRMDEKAVFEWFIGFVHERWREDPGMHVYHYNHYEPTAMDRLADRHQTMAEVLGGLMGRFSTKEDEGDTLIRNRVFVDLYPIFRQSIRAGIESYSLKQTEKVAGYERRQLLDEADEYMYAFQRSLEDSADTAKMAGRAQEVIAAYNEDDCRATLHLRDWLEARRTDLQELLGEVIPRPPLPRVEIEPETDLGALKAALRQQDTDLTDKENQARALLADLLEFQKREDRPAWWEYYRLRELDGEELLPQRHALAGLAYAGHATDAAGVPVRLGNRFVHVFEFSPQEHGMKEGSFLFDPREFRFEEQVDEAGNTTQKSKDGARWEVVDIDDGTGLLSIACMAEHPDPPPEAFVTGKPGTNKAPSENLLLLAEEVRAQGSFASRPAGTQLLMRNPPELNEGAALPITREPVSVFAVEIGSDLGATYLPIQGPPGTGKTYTGAEIALNLIGSGHRVGVTGPTHQSVRTFLKELAERRDHHGVRFAIGQYSSKKSDLWEDVDQPFTDTAEARVALAAGDIDVLGGTAWLWSGPTMQETVDTLMIDEAGQLSLALALAASAATRHSLVLLGDPQQLPQVTQGTHPEGAGASALEHVLGDEKVLLEGQGIFIDRTRRMHPLITDFVSTAFYEDMLEVEPGLGLERQELIGPLAPTGFGLRIIDVEHFGNNSSSSEEAAKVAELVSQVVGRDWSDATGGTRKITIDDVLVVTPYNAHIREIGQALRALGAPAVTVGTVDRFQGSEAAVVIYSMATSSAEEAPRGMEFLYQLNRLNVAVSRAKALVMVVMSPELVRVDCKTPRQMQLANALCLFRERAT